MMPIFAWIVPSILLILATYLSAIELALADISQAGLARALESSNREHKAAWLSKNARSAVLMATILRTLASIAFFGFILFYFVDFEAEHWTFWLELVGACAVAVLLLWIVRDMVTQALVVHAGTKFLAHSIPAVSVLIFLGCPFSWLFRFVDEVVRRLSGVHLETEDKVEAELLQSIEDTHREGGLDEHAAAMLENVVEFNSTDVGEVMTPRTDVEGIELTDDLTFIRSFIVDAGHSRIPVYKGSLDQIAGILYVKDLIPYLGEDTSDFKLSPLLRQPIVVPESRPVRELLADFQRSEVHLAIVIDEYGGTLGLVTIEDVLEEIVGEIHDEHEPNGDEEPELRMIDKRHAEVDGRFHIDDLNEKLRLSLPEDEEYDTVGGYLLAYIGRVPQVGEVIEAAHTHFTVLQATPTHIQRVAVALVEAPLTNGEHAPNDDE